MPLSSPLFLPQSVNPNTLAATLGGSTFRVDGDGSAKLKTGMPPPSKGVITSYPFEAVVVLLDVSGSMSLEVAVTSEARLCSVC